MNIGVDLRGISAKNKTGVGEFTLNLLSAVLKNDQTNRYFLFSNSAKKQGSPAFNQKNVIVIHTRFPNKLLNLALYSGLLKIEQLLPKPIDCWYSPNLNFISLNKNTKHIQTIHDLSFEFYPEFYTLKQRLWHYFINPRKLCEAADIVVAPSENTKRDLIKFFRISTDKIKIVHPSLSPYFSETSSELEKQKSLLQKKYYLPENFILFLASIEPRKNILTTIKAYEKLPSHLTDKYHLIIAGAKGWKNCAVYNAANHSKLKNKIKFLGYIKDEVKPALYALANLFIFPSVYEGFGLPVIEAMQMGAVVITSNRSSLNEITKNAALLVNPDNANTLSNAICTLLSDTELKNIYKKRGVEIASTFSAETSAQAWLKIINSLT